MQFYWKLSPVYSGSSDVEASTAATEAAWFQDFC